MKVEAGKISGFQLALLICGVGLGASVVLNPAQSLGPDAWLAVLVGMGEGLLIIGVFLILAARFKGQTLIQINDLIFGVYLGKVVSLLYLWYFLHLGSLVLRNFSDFFVTVVYKETPPVVFMILLILCCASVIRNGLEVLARCGTVIIPLVLLAIILDTVLLLKEMELSYFLPIMDVSWPEFWQASISIAAFPFGEIIGIMMIMPFVTDRKKNAKVVISAVIMVGFFLTLITARNTAVLGTLGTIQTYPSYLAIRLIDLAEVITRLEIIVTAAMLTAGFLKVSVFYYGVVLGIAQLFSLRSYLPLVLPLAVILVSLSIFQLESVMENLVFATVIYPYYASFFQIGLPLLSLLIALMRGIAVREKGQEGS